MTSGYGVIPPTQLNDAGLRKRLADAIKTWESETLLKRSRMDAATALNSGKTSCRKTFAFGNEMREPIGSQQEKA